VLFVAALPVIFGFFALVIDGGLYFVKERAAQNAATRQRLPALRTSVRSRQMPSGRRVRTKPSQRRFEYADTNLPDGTPVPVLLAQDAASPVSSTNPNSKIRVTVTAETTLFFGQVLGISSPRPVGQCGATESDGQCATASAAGGPRTETRTWTETRYPNRLFAFAMGDHDGERCEFGVDIRGSRNVFEGEV